ncbi:MULTISPECIES: YaaA family protein [unclassified Luteococcus]|uniref:YaaA family protein n=1 Tax=unclassified Luteococcus TaxID=2639923 RepID=UPI00313C1B24
MLVLLPPSEGKATTRRGRPMDLAALSLPELTGARRQVLDALATVSAQPDALTVLKVGASLADDVEANTRLLTAPALRARELYTGVLYDALDLKSLPAADSRRATGRLLVMSAAHGAVRLNDRVSPYRLAMDVDLPGVGPLTRFWAPRLAEVLPAQVGSGIVVDCRSTSYRAAWKPTPELAERWVVVDVPGASHWAKHTRGLVARRLCQTDVVKRVTDLPAALGEGFDVELVLPKRPGKPWAALVTAR